MVEKKPFNSKIKKIVAREFLILFGSVLIVLLIWGGLEGRDYYHLNIFNSLKVETDSLIREKKMIKDFYSRKDRGRLFKEIEKHSTMIDYIHDKYFYGNSRWSVGYKILKDQQSFEKYLGVVYKDNYKDKLTRKEFDDKYYSTFGNPFKSGTVIGKDLEKLPEITRYYLYLQSVGEVLPEGPDNLNVVLSNEDNAKIYYKYLKENKFDVPKTYESFVKTLKIKIDPTGKLIFKNLKERGQYNFERFIVILGSIENKNKDMERAKEKMLSAAKKKEIVFWVCFGIISGLFFLRYLFYAVSWSIITLNS